MVIIKSLDEIKHNKNTVVTLGTFDGFHLGHQQILKSVVEKTKQYSGRNILITFDPHPRKIVSTKNHIKILSTLDEKKEVLSKLGIENLFVINFTKEFSQQSPKQFVTKYLLEGIGVREVVIGYDHHFGKGRGGNFDLLNSLGEKYKFKITPIPEYKVGDETVSSTKIRNALIDGDIAKANKMLGRYYSFKGKVIKGDGRGKQLGYPTANLMIENEDKLLPAIGIYAAQCEIDGEKHKALLSIGSRPTFSNDGKVVPEIYILDFDKDIYNQKLQIIVIQRIRGEEKFNSAEELIKQMDKDKEAGLKIFKEVN
ncbi:MAG: bifunctional riboflavin kinase/FAD synthetase [Ignavibacteria bacterium]|nr:bifunctional riboflavin kinase/FAD synthetase [Ignavibacteria bacterium]MBT8381728.1 bifunctional riboflavin kinase/FAD synthetase [Ignavibacteria bacterium]MBT8391099.1 bifunctional riboflavin kinase/FAD synthetase [Ignavibacteria bacterium]NNJ53686.1 bifunctional riboflavin kinase/FAD synthetase [Ignavibacteriaceae bacterium]NNL21588.1 bifunctional riboflavin kinase/FAD synthetase [Ignavibacteriaceae bacterium]